MYIAYDIYKYVNMHGPWLPLKKLNGRSNQQRQSSHVNSFALKKHIQGPRPNFWEISCISKFKNHIYNI